MEKTIYNLEFLRERAQEKRKQAEERLQNLRRELKGEFEHKRKASRGLSIVEGSFNAVSDGMGSRYISPFALSLGATTAQIGLLSSLPTLFGNFTQIFSSRAMEKFSRKKIIVLFTTLQALFWLAVLFAGVLFFIIKTNSFVSVSFLIIAYTLLVAFGAFISPIWSSWMKDLVDPDKSGKYFGTRSKIIGFVSLISMLVGGFVLDYFKGTKVFAGFFILFAICFLARLISSQLFRKKYEPDLKIEKDYHFSLWQFIKKMRHNNFGKFVIAISLMNFAVNIASPFFAVYMLKNLGFSYLIYTIVVISSIVGNLIFMPLWGRFADRYGNVKTIKISAFLTTFVPLLWFASFFLFKAGTGLILFLIFTELYSGAVFSGFSLTTGNFIYDAVTRQRMALCTSYFNVLNGIAVFLGATFAGILASRADLIFGISIFLAIFLVSGILRLLFSLTFVNRFNEVRMTEPFKFVDISGRIKGLTPARFWQYLDVLNFRAE